MLRRRGHSAREAGNDGDQEEIRNPTQLLGERLGRLAGPQVLILEVDEPLGTTKRLAVRAPDAPLALWREGVGRALGRIGAQNLDGRAAGRGRIGPCRRERVGSARLPSNAAQRDPNWVPMIERGRVTPAFTKRVGEIADCRAAYQELDVVPCWLLPVLRV